MAVTTNTTKSIKHASSVLAKKCADTKKNMTALAKKAGIKTPEMVSTMIPKIPGSYDDVVFVGLNGVNFYFMRGESVDVPKQIVEILKNCGHL
ncbi:MAG: hypothetical protein IJD60_07540 [Clostridia bacterium]|nr:hypothetical protein [Clostridia bacterium]